MRTDTRATLGMIALSLAAASARARDAPALRFTGDFRLRYENTSEGSF